MTLLVVAMVTLSLTILFLSPTHKRLQYSSLPEIVRSWKSQPGTVFYLCYFYWVLKIGNFHLLYDFITFVLITLIPVII